MSLLQWTLDYRHLRVGVTYVVARAFRDYDGGEHPAGEGWMFLGHNYFPHDNGLTLYVANASGAFGTVRLQCGPDEQGPIDDALDQYFVVGDIGLDHSAFAREIASRISPSSSLWSVLALELVSRMPSVPSEIASAIIARLDDVTDTEVPAMIMALYNMTDEAAPHWQKVEALCDRSGRARTVADALLRKMGRA